jgi:hypothetical protein
VSRAGLALDEVGDDVVEHRLVAGGEVTLVRVDASAGGTL